MPNISDILSTTLLKHQINLGLSVKISQFLEAKLPELGVSVRIHSRVIAAECCSTIVTKPHIETIPYHHESWSNVRIVDDPRRRTAQNSVLEKDSRSTFVGELAPYAVHS